MSDTTGWRTIGPIRCPFTWARQCMYRRSTVCLLQHDDATRAVDTWPYTPVACLHGNTAAVAAGRSPRHEEPYYQSLPTGFQRMGVSRRVTRLSARQGSTTGPLSFHAKQVMHGHVLPAPMGHCPSLQGTWSQMTWLDPSTLVQKTDVCSL